MVAVKPTLNTSGKVETRSRDTAMPRSVGTRRPFSRCTYSREVIVPTIVAYVLGRPMFSSSRAFTSDASL